MLFVDQVQRKPVGYSCETGSGVLAQDANYLYKKLSWKTKKIKKKYVKYLGTVGWRTRSKSSHNNYTRFGFMELFSSASLRLLFWPRFTSISNFYDCCCRVFTVGVKNTHFIGLTLNFSCSNYKSLILLPSRWMKTQLSWNEMSTSQICLFYEE